MKTFFGHTNWVTTARFGPDGRVVASGGTDRVVNIWDFESGERIFDFKEHGGNINAVRFVPETNCNMVYSNNFRSCNMFRRQVDQDI